MTTSKKAAKTAHRRFESVQGTADKFWEVETSDSSVTVCYGRNGTAGESNTTLFADAGAALRHVENLISEKLAKGYSEVTPQ